MGVILGLTLGAGSLLIWLSFFPRRQRARATIWDLMQDSLVQAGWPTATPAGLIGLSAGLGIVLAGVIALLTGALAVSGAFGLIAAMAPAAIVRSRASRRRTTFHDLWPEAIEGIISAARAGMSLPEAVGSLAYRGPEPMRPQFRGFAADYAATARFDDSLRRLKDRFADPVADRVIEALRLTREVGGMDLVSTLRALVTMLRADLRTRGELRARQSWTVNSARLAVAAPWLVLAVLGARTDAVAAYDSPTGVLILAGGAAACAGAYWMMLRIGALPEDRRVLR